MWYSCRVCLENETRNPVGPGITAEILLTLNSVTNTNIVAFTHGSPRNVPIECFSPDAGLHLNFSSFVDFSASRATGSSSDSGGSMGEPLDAIGNTLGCGENANSTYYIAQL